MNLLTRQISKLQDPADQLLKGFPAHLLQLLFRFLYRQFREDSILIQIYFVRLYFMSYKFCVLFTSLFSLSGLYARIKIKRWPMFGINSLMMASSRSLNSFCPIICSVENCYFKSIFCMKQIYIEHTFESV